MARRDFDVNRERLVFATTSMVGHRVTVTMRNKSVYEGLFHSCSLDGDYSITLKCARVPPQGSDKSGEVIQTLVIPGKDFLQVSASDIPPPSQPDSDVGQKGFMTDTEISGNKAAAEERELVPFYAGGDQGPALEGEALDEGDNAGAGAGQWDQFEQNSQMYGITSTYREDLYTTKLDPSAIPREKREEADRIAREIEGAPQNAEIDGRIDAQDQDGDEEAAFSAVSALNRKVPLTEENLSQLDRDNFGIPADGFAREHRTKRGMITAHSAHSPLRSPMISEMKRINALNLEPALPKLDDKTRNDWINFKQNQSRTAAKSVPGNAGLKSDFLKSLDLFKNREAAAKQKSSEDNPRSSGRREIDEGKRDRRDSGERVRQDAADGRNKGKGASSAPSDFQGSMIPAKGGKRDAAPTTPGGSAFKFNASAKEFSFNPSASMFTPGSPMGSTPAPAPTNASSSQGKGPPQQLSEYRVPRGSDLLKKRLTDLLDVFYDRSSRDNPETERPEWPQATAATYREGLGPPAPGGVPMPPGTPMGGQGNMPGQWRQAPNQMGPPGGAVPQGQMQPGGPPQMQAFMVTAGPGGGQPQMYPQMFPGQGGCAGGVPGNMQGVPQNGGGMPQGQPMIMMQPGMMQQGGPQGQQGGPQMMPGGMCGGQGQNAMGAVPKFGGQMVPVNMMGPGGQFQQGFVQQQGGPGPQGPQGQMMQQQQQGQMGMQPGWGQPNNQRQMGGGAPHGMGGMDG